jgi:hypothetical protein
VPHDIQIYFAPGSKFFSKALLKVCGIGSIFFLQMNRFVNQTKGEVVPLPLSEGRGRPSSFFQEIQEPRPCYHDHRFPFDDSRGH